MEFNSNSSNIAGGKYSPDSFYNGLWLADVLGRLIHERPEMLAVWQLKNNSGGLGLMTSFERRPPYYAYVMWKKFGNHLLAASSDTKYLTIYAAKTDDGAVTVMLVNLNGEEVRRPLKLVKGSSLKLSEVYLFDAAHNAAAMQPPAFTNGSEVVLPAESVTLLVFK